MAWYSGLLCWAHHGPQSVHVPGYSCGTLRISKFIRVSFDSFYAPNTIMTMHSDFFPVLVAFLRKVPVIGDFLNAPGVAQVHLLT